MCVYQDITADLQENLIYTKDVFITTYLFRTRGNSVEIKFVQNALRKTN